MAETPKPSVGRIVHYKLPDSNRSAGQVRPAAVVRVWSDTCVNLQVFTDGTNDELPNVHWVTSALQGDGSGQWSWPPRV